MEGQLRTALVVSSVGSNAKNPILAQRKRFDRSVSSLSTDSIQEAIIDRNSIRF